MSLVRWIVAGFGWELGKSAAKEAVDGVREREEPRPEVSEAERARAAKDAERAAAKRAKERAKEAKAREREVDRELAALKRRIGK